MNQNNIIKYIREGQTMKTAVYLFIILLFISLNLYAKKKISAEKKVKGKTIYKLPFYVFSHKSSISYFALSGYMGDVQNIKILKIRDNYSFKTSLKVIYTPTHKDDSLGWAGVFWQWPPNNWGRNEAGGYDLRKAKYLYFYAKGEKGDELIEFKVGGTQGTFGDSASATTGVINLTKKWKLYKIDLTKKDLRNIIAGFGFLIKEGLNPDGAVFYLNDIYYSNKKPEPPFFKGYLRLNKIKKN